MLSTKLLRVGFGRGGAPVEEGARTSAFLASDPSVAGVTGRYFVASREAAAHPDASRADVGARVWALSEALVSRAGFSSATSRFVS